MCNFYGTVLLHFVASITIQQADVTLHVLQHDRNKDWNRKATLRICSGSGPAVDQAYLYHSDDLCHTLKAASENYRDMESQRSIIRMQRVLIKLQSTSAPGSVT